MINIIINAYAKINLSLDITGKRDNGYHDLDSIMQSINLYDRVEILKNKSCDIKVSCAKIPLPTDERNIAYRAAQAFLKNFNITSMGVDIHITKNIPIQAGLGGGSADAAAVLKGLVELFQVETSHNEMMNLALSLGADVPFCLVGGTKRCKGVGEILLDSPPLPDCKLILCKPQAGVDTKEAYAVSDKYPSYNFFGTQSLLVALRSKNLKTIAENISNRFDDVLMIPEVSLIKAVMQTENAMATSMSGSGSTAFALFEESTDTSQLEQQLRNLGTVYVCKPQRVGLSSE